MYVIMVWRHMENNDFRNLSPLGILTITTVYARIHTHTHINTHIHTHSYKHSLTHGDTLLTSYLCDIRRISFHFYFFYSNRTSTLNSVCVLFFRLIIIFNKVSGHGILSRTPTTIFLAVRFTRDYFFFCFYLFLSCTARIYPPIDGISYMCV